LSLRQRHGVCRARRRNHQETLALATVDLVLLVVE
jgi:hypothetical protein